MDENKTPTSPATYSIDQPALYEKAEHNIQLVLEMGQRRILVSFPTDEEAAAYYECVKFTNLSVKRQYHVYLHLTEQVNHITLQSQLGIVFKSAAHAEEWLLRTRLERCFTRKQKTLWLRKPWGLEGAVWAEAEAGAGQTDLSVAAAETINGEVTLKEGTSGIEATATSEKQGRWAWCLRVLRRRSGIAP